MAMTRRGDFLSIDQRKLRELAGRGSGLMVRDVTLRTATIASATAPGSMKQKIRPIISGTKRMPLGIVMVDHPAAHFVMEGTKPHPIVAKGGALRFKWKGKTVFFKSVNHPGTDPNPFLWKAMIAASKV